MHIKLEKMLPVWLAPVYGTIIFTFGEEFAYDIRMAKKKAREERRRLGIESDSDDEDDEYDTEDEEAARAEKAAVGGENPETELPVVNEADQD
jgi:hypothetical protein